MQDDMGKFCENFNPTMIVAARTVAGPSSAQAAAVSPAPRLLTGTTLAAFALCRQLTGYFG
jgi:hypothetical protein